MVNMMLVAAAVLVSVSSLALGQEHNRKKTLIVYFSVTGTTQELAEQIHSQMGGDLVELIPAVPYSKVYPETVARHRQEQSSNALPEIATAIPNMDEYDTVLVGYPIWSGTVPRILRTFFQQYDLAGKTIAPFCTHGGGGAGRSVQDIRSLCSGATVTDGLSLRSASRAREDVAGWLRKIGIGEQ